MKFPGSLSFEDESDFDEDRALSASWTSLVDMGVLMADFSEFDPPVGALGVMGRDRATRAYPRTTEEGDTTAAERAAGEVVSESPANRWVSEVVSPETALWMCACAQWCCLGARQSREVMSGDVGSCPEWKGVVGLFEMSELTSTFFM